MDTAKPVDCVLSLLFDMKYTPTFYFYSVILRFTMRSITSS